MNCRIIYKDNKIDHVQAENGERSILFDSLKDIFGAEKALELYALTEEDGYKQKIQEKVRSFVGVTEKQIDKLSEVIDAQETLNKLVETGLADNVYQMTSEELEAKLVELGVEADVAKQVVAYHGSPHNFDRFTTEKMGTGEGAQAFGWGLYFTDLESIARNYAKNLSTVKFKGQDITQVNFFDLLFTGLDASNFDFYNYQNGRIHNLKEFKKYVDDNVNYLSNLTVDENSPSILRLLSDYEYREEKIKQAKENIKLTKDTDFKNLQDNLVKAGLDIKTAKNIADDAKRSRDGNLNYLKNSIKYLASRETTVKTIIESEKRRNKSSLNYFKFIQNNFDNIEMARNLYKVSLHKGKTPSEYTWLEWDKPLTKDLKNKIDRAILTSNLSPNTIRELSINLNKFEGSYGDIYKSLEQVFKNSKELSLSLLNQGIDGVKFPAESISRGATSDTARGFNYVVFDENAITIEEQIQFQKSTAVQQAEPRGYYSNAQEALTNLKDKNPKNVKGWVSQLTDVQKNGGIKNVNQELEWIGLEDYLNEYVKENNPKAGNIPSSVVEDYIKSNQIEIVDVSKGTASDDMSKPEVRDEFYNEAREALAIQEELNEESEDILDTWYNNPTDSNFNEVKLLLEDVGVDLSYIYDKNSNEINNATKYSGYQLKGGENYREVLLTMPNKEVKTRKKEDIAYDIKVELQNIRESVEDDLYNNFLPKNNGYEVTNNKGEVLLGKKGGNPIIVEDITSFKEDILPSVNEKIIKEAENNSEKLRKLRDEFDSFYNPVKKEEYKSSHWDEANILAHVRLNEKTLPDGRRVLIVNEIQADISQDLKKEQDKILDRVDKEFDNFLDNLIMNKVIIEEC
jgi:hypothetical protein